MILCHADSTSSMPWIGVPPRAWNHAAVAGARSSHAERSAPSNTRMSCHTDSLRFASTHRTFSAQTCGVTNTNMDSRGSIPPGSADRFERSEVPLVAGSAATPISQAECPSATKGCRRVLLNHDQRRRLAAKGRVLGRKLLGEVCTIITPDTILRSLRELVARKYDGSAKRRGGRAGVMRTIRERCGMMATENPGWGCTRIQGALDNLGHRASPSSIRRILKENGRGPAPQRHMP